MSERVFCCEENPDEPMIGTADRVDVWVLLEYRPTWKAKALADNGLDAQTRRWLEENLAALEAAGLKARPQFIRRPELDRDETRLFVATTDGLFTAAGVGYEFLQDIRLPDALDSPAGFERIESPRYFVCTNGQRDVCCARYGLPIYAALRERVGERVWQITHLGGHRFAPNVLVLPQGALYGRLAEGELDDFVARVEAGELAFDRLRGRSSLPPAAQAAEALGRRSDLSSPRIVEAGDGALDVTFDAPEGPVTIRVRRAREPRAVLKSCADEEPMPVTPFLPA
jgi:hypothetical protein